jgi:hypothetical protein
MISLMASLETRVHNSVPESKQQLVEWQHKDSPQKKKFKAQMDRKCHVFHLVGEESKGVILVHFLKRDSSSQCVETLKKVKS